MKIYVATSWRNVNQPTVVSLLRGEGYDVYDFREEGFSWSKIDHNWQNWTPTEYVKALNHPEAEKGFERDMKYLSECDVCIYITPCGPSASMEMGWAKGMGKDVFAYVPEIHEADLMLKMCDGIYTRFEELLIMLKSLNEEPHA